MFIDPAGQYQLQLPLGWAYDPDRSHLITVTFAHWERPSETVSVRAMPTFAPAGASPEEWYEALQERALTPSMRPLTTPGGSETHTCGGAPAALAEVHETDPEGVHRRMLFLRGTRLDVLAEHRAPEPSGGPPLSDVLSSICRSLEVPTNRFLPALVEQSAVISSLDRAQEAVQRQAWREALDQARQARDAAQSTYLYSVVANAPLPEIPAIIALLDALIFSAQATGSLLPLRDAEQLALRTLHTLRHLPFLPSSRRRGIGQALTSRLTAIVDLHVAIAQPQATDPQRPLTHQREAGRPLPHQREAQRPSPGPGLAMLRAERLLEEAGQAADAEEHTLALLACETGVADLLTVLSAPLRMENMPAEIVRKLMAAGAETPEEQERLARVRMVSIRKIARRLPLSMLQGALPILSSLRSTLGDVVGSTEAGEFLLTLARKLGRAEAVGAGVEISPGENQPKQLAIALIAQVNNLVDIADEPSLALAQQRLDEAEALLDGIDEEGALRASLCLAQAFLLHSLRRLEGAFEIIDRGLRAAAAEPDLAEGTMRQLQTIKSQFLINAGRVQEARQLALEVAQLPEGDDPRARLRHANYYLNLATADMGLSRPEAAAESLRQALRRTLAVSPFGEETLRILMVASRLHIERDVRLGHRLNLAAAATLDARRATIGSDTFRVGFDEATRRREVYEDLVGRLVALGAGKEAVAAADRSRARSLVELLAPRALDDGRPTSPALETSPSLAGDDVRRALAEAAEYVIRNADRVLHRRGAVPPLQAHEIEPLAQELGAPLLMIQPVHGQVALLFIRPSGEIEMHFSPFSLGELRHVLGTVHSQFHIRSGARGAGGNADAAPQSDDAGDALGKLWEALIGPICHDVAQGEPLMIVPYREFALVPFALLPDPEGHPLVEHHALSIAPSLATLRTLRRRGPWSRPIPTRTYVAGDPTLAPKYRSRMGRLLVARAEAEAVATTLRTAGVSEENVLLRLTKAAHEESYRREARGCDLVHLSCHAKMDQPAYTSCLFFAPHGPYDGLLLASEVADVRLDDALVFLAACETGQGRATADGVIGLGRAFLEAGARAVVLSLWGVEDAATAALSGHFYRALLSPQTPLSSAAALRAAMLATRTDLEAGRIRLGTGEPLKPRPAHWAPFTILGDGLAVRYRSR